ncbi:hypothetical protein N177_0465 [Lutibaculum baratangense AMV1]|uniref:Uncharacterized protein n=1 Tax=Lutibaculum baratangense AMV1 TaxID=631454 RepID=V4RP44_9HYPH|nr:hypothetical protein N177_0465 [Lutibaculum baratangense AMV1]
MRSGPGFAACGGDAMSVPQRKPPPGGRRGPAAGVSCTQTSRRGQCSAAP